MLCQLQNKWLKENIVNGMVRFVITVDVSYAAPQAHEIVNVALHREYSPGVIFIFSQGRKYFYHV
jgi:hypothetical protein